MATWKPDPSFYPSPRLAMQAPPERLAYVVTITPDRSRPDALVVADVDPGSSTYGRIVGRVEMPNAGDELHHFGWNACSSALCPSMPHPHIVVSLKDLSSSVWMWQRANGKWEVRKVIEIPAEPADPAQLPPALKPFSAVPPLVSDINLSVDDRFLYVSCWGTGEFRQYDVSDPSKPQLTGSVRLGGIVSRAPHPAAGAVNGGPQMVEVSRDGKRIYVSNSLYASWDAQFYPDGIRGWVAKLDADPAGGIRVDPEFFVEFDGQRPHQIRLEGGDASSDSFCFS